MDDGGFERTWRPFPGVGSVPLLRFMSWLDASCSLTSPLEGVPLVPTDEIFMLGVPLGSKSKNADFVKHKLFSRLDKVTDRLKDFDDSQSALFLLRVSFGIVRATHFMRTTPLTDWTEESAHFDLQIRTAAAILGFTFEDESSYLQACLTPSLGGLGLRRTAVHADTAYVASFLGGKV